MSKFTAYTTTEANKVSQKTAFTLSWQGMPIHTDEVVVKHGDENGQSMRQIADFFFRLEDITRFCASSEMLKASTLAEVQMLIQSRSTQPIPMGKIEDASCSENTPSPNTPAHQPTQQSEPDTTSDTPLAD